MAALDREVKYLVNKAKLWRPKKTEKKSNQNQTFEENIPEGGHAKAKVLNVTDDVTGKADKSSGTATADGGNNDTVANLNKDNLKEKKSNKSKRVPPVLDEASFDEKGE